MYGLVNKAIEELICTVYGAAAWQTVRARAGVEDTIFLSMQPYPDELTYRLVEAASAVLALPQPVILRTFGRYWTLYTAAQGYGDLIRLTGATLFEFLHNLDNLHARVGLSYTRLQPPSFVCTDVAADALTIHYHSQRLGLAPMVQGLLEGLAELYQTPASVTLLACRAHGAGHDIFRITLAEDTP